MLSRPFALALLFILPLTLDQAVAWVFLSLSPLWGFGGFKTLSGFALWVLGFGFWVLGFGFWLDLIIKK
ncbi:Uncharacterised protein [Klebsiella pneumoniae]|nr:Uncharacterised protein [Klebsiella pneumoniae]